ncbi:MAG: DNA mismatch repair protein MutS, partial [Gemmatimonadales bacterium]
ETGCKTVFATHYHELTQLTDELVAACNYSVQVREVDGRVLFLHRLVPGGADRSYGIEVGRLAGLPEQVLQRARALLSLFEGEQIVSALGTRTRGSGEAVGKKKNQTAAVDQLGLFSSVPHPLVEELKQIDPNELTPIEALALLNRLVGRARQG